MTTTNAPEKGQKEGTSDWRNTECRVSAHWLPPARPFALALWYAPAKKNIDQLHTGGVCVHMYLSIYVYLHVWIYTDDLMKSLQSTWHLWTHKLCYPFQMYSVWHISCMYYVCMLTHGFFQPTHELSHTHTRMKEVITSAQCHPQITHPPPSLLFCQECK